MRFRFGGIETTKTPEGYRIRQVGEAGLQPRGTNPYQEVAKKMTDVDSLVHQNDQILETGRDDRATLEALNELDARMYELRLQYADKAAEKLLEEIRGDVGKGAFSHEEGARLERLLNYGKE